MRFLLAFLLAMSVWFVAQAEENDDPWIIKMKQPYTFDQYCLTTRNSVTYKVILDENSSIVEVVNAYFLDYHHKTTVLYPGVIPWLYAFFMIIMLAGLAGFMVSAVKVSEKLIKGYANHKLKKKELERPVYAERRSESRERNGKEVERETIPSV